MQGQRSNCKQRENQKHVNQKARINALSLNLWCCGDKAFLPIVQFWVRCCSTTMIVHAHEAGQGLGDGRKDATDVSLNYLSHL
eukprot:3296860-Amphidinium_carterae.1